MEIGHLTWAPTLEGPALAQEDERFGFDIRYFGDNTCMHDDVFSELRTRPAPPRRSSWAPRSPTP